MPSKVKKKGFLYGTWISSSGMTLEGEMPAAKFIGIIYGMSKKQEREAIRAEIASNEQEFKKDQ